MTPQELADCCDRCLALAADWPWRHPAASAFADWLVGHWTMACPVVPPGVPAAVSVLGHTPDGIRWYAGAGEVLGYVARSPRGCYRVPTAAVPPVPLP